MNALMFSQAGQNQGERDGYADAVSGKKNYPRPNLTLSVVSTGYRDSYLAAYKKAYSNAKYAKMQQQVRSEREHQKAGEVLSPTGTHKATCFDVGWRDGFIDVPIRQSTHLSRNEREAYNRGYKLGERAHDFARSKALHQKLEREATLGQDSPNQQGLLDKER